MVETRAEGFASLKCPAPTLDRQLAEVRVKRVHPLLKNTQSLHSASRQKHPDYFFVSNILPQHP